MIETPKHTKVRTFEPQDDDTMLIKTKSYHEKPSGYKEEIVKHINTSHATFLSDVVACLDVVKGVDASPELILTITTRNGMPHLITKQWTTKKETYNKR